MERVIIFEEHVYHQHRFVVKCKDKDDFEESFDKLRCELGSCENFSDLYYFVGQNFDVEEADEDYSEESDGVEYMDDYALEDE